MRNSFNNAFLSAQERADNRIQQNNVTAQQTEDNKTKNLEKQTELNSLAKTIHLYVSLQEELDKNPDQKNKLNIKKQQKKTLDEIKSSDINLRDISRDDLMFMYKEYDKLCDQQKGKGNGPKSREIKKECFAQIGSNKNSWGQNVINKFTNSDRKNLEIVDKEFHNEETQFRYYLNKAKEISSGLYQLVKDTFFGAKSNNSTPDVSTTQPRKRKIPTEKKSSVIISRESRRTPEELIPLLTEDAKEARQEPRQYYKEQIPPIQDPKKARQEPRQTSNNDTANALKRLKAALERSQALMKEQQLREEQASQQPLKSSQASQQPLMKEEQPLREGQDQRQDSLELLTMQVEKTLNEEQQREQQQREQKVKAQARSHQLPPKKVTTEKPVKPIQVEKTLNEEQQRAQQQREQQQREQKVKAQARSHQLPPKKVTTEKPVKPSGQDRLRVRFKIEEQEKKTKGTSRTETGNDNTSQKITVSKGNPEEQLRGLRTNRNNAYWNMKFYKTVKEEFKNFTNKNPTIGTSREVTITLTDPRTGDSKVYNLLFENQNGEPTFKLKQNQNRNKAGITLEGVDERFDNAKEQYDVASYMLSRAELGQQENYDPQYTLESKGLSQAQSPGNMGAVVISSRPQAGQQNPLGTRPPVKPDNRRTGTAGKPFGTINGRGFGR